MNYHEFLDRVVSDGIEAVKKDYSKPEQEPKRRGAIQGFEDCRGKSPTEIAELLKKAEKRTFEASIRVNESEISDGEYWAIRCREAEIEWVANVVSAMLMNQGLPIIVAPTARGAMKAAEIVGVEGRP